MQLVVEAGSDRVKILYVGRRGPALDVLGSGLQKTGLTGEALAGLLQKIGARNAPVVACLPRQSVTLRLLELPSTRPEELRDMVELQLAKQTPLSRDEVAYDFKLIGPGRQGYSRVMVTIVQRSLLRQRFSLLQDAGLDVRRMAVGTEGLLTWSQNFFARGGRTGVNVVVDVDSGASDVLVVAEGRLLFNRIVAVGAESLAEGGEASARKLAAEIRLCLEAFRTEGGNVSGGRLVLTGARRASEPEVIEALSGALGLPVEYRDALDSMRKGAKGGDIPDLDDSFAAIAGLAQSGGRTEINLVPETVKLKEDMSVRARSLSRFAALIMTGLVVLSAQGTVQMFHASARLNTLKAEVAGLEERAREVEQEAELTRAVRQIRDSRRSAMNILLQVHASRASGIDVVFEQFEYDGDKGTVQLAGNSASNDDIRRLVQNLEASALFENVQEGGETSLDQRSRRYKFRINLSIEGDA